VSGIILGVCILSVGLSCIARQDNTALTHCVW